MLLVLGKELTYVNEDYSRNIYGISTTVEGYVTLMTTDEYPAALLIVMVH